MSNSKLTRVWPIEPKTVAPYVRGTESGHFYLVVNEGVNGSIVGFRPLSVNYPEIGSTPGSENTRVRFVPSGDVTPALRNMMIRLGFEFRPATSTGSAHFSQVSNDPQALVDAATDLIALIG